jgi:hypothetical protein
MMVVARGLGAPRGLSGRGRVCGAVYPGFRSPSTNCTLGWAPPVFQTVVVRRQCCFDHEPITDRHNRSGEVNANAHLKRQVVGREVVVAITAGKLDFGPWEQIFYDEFDGRRPKRVLVKVIGD